jgi:hypothetical protein
MLPELPKLGVARPDAHVMVQHLPQKTLFSAQNPENKGAVFFLPPRSMVLKVVTANLGNMGVIVTTARLPGFRLETAITLDRDIYLSMIGGPRRDELQRLSDCRW